MTSTIITVLIMLNVTLFIVLIRKFTLPQISDRKNQRLIQSMQTKTVSLESEISRQLFVINDYKSKLNFTENATKSKITTFVPDESIGKIQDVLNDKQILEKEKEVFKQKNQKLWEQSLAVYKEKERIDAIRKYIESEHKNLTHSINYALRIQEALLPSEELLKQIFPNYFILFRPRDIVSGDFYWVRKKNNKTILITADCTGHGVPGAFMSLLGISYLNEIFGKSENLSASGLLEEMRSKVKSAFQQDGNITIQDGMDMVACIIDHDKKELEFSGANNGIFIAKNDKTLVEIKGTRSPISHYRKEKSFVNHKVPLEINDTVFMYSDGYFDQFGGENKQKINRSRFSSILKDCLQNNSDISGYKSALDSFLDNWQGNEIQIDDILVFGVTCFSE